MLRPCLCAAVAGRESAPLQHAHAWLQQLGALQEPASRDCSSPLSHSRHGRYARCPRKRQTHGLVGCCCSGGHQDCLWRGRRRRRRCRTGPHWVAPQRQPPPSPRPAAFWPRWRRRAAAAASASTARRRTSRRPRRTRAGRGAGGRPLLRRQVRCLQPPCIHPAPVLMRAAAWRSHVHSPPPRRRVAAVGRGWPRADSVHAAWAGPAGSEGPPGSPRHSRCRPALRARPACAACWHLHLYLGTCPGAAAACQCTAVWMRDDEPHWAPTS